MQLVIRGQVVALGLSAESTKEKWGDSLHHTGKCLDSLSET